MSWCMWDTYVRSGLWHHLCSIFQRVWHHEQLNWRGLLENSWRDRIVRWCVWENKKYLLFKEGSVRESSSTAFGRKKGITEIFFKALIIKTEPKEAGSNAEHELDSPSSVWLDVRWLAASLSLSRRALRCFSSSRCFSALASSQRPSSIRRWSGLRRLSVGATPSSGSFRVRAKVVK